MDRSHSTENTQQQYQRQVPQLVIQPPEDEDLEDDEGSIEQREVVDPASRYFNRTNIICIISSLVISIFFIFEPQFLAYFWRIYAPEETAEYLINLKTCKIPNLYDGQSELPFMWDLDMSRNGNLGHIDFQCESVEQFSDVIDDEKLTLMAKLKKRKCCVRNITRPEIMENDMYRVSTNCKEFTASGTDITGSEFLLVQCVHTRNKTVDFNTHALLPSKAPVVEKILHWSSKYNKKDDLPFSVAVIVISSTSRAHAYRSLPETMKYLEGSTAQFTVMNGYQSMEDNSPVVSMTSSNILPLLTGITDPSTVKWASRFDNFSMLWSRFSDENYVTMFMDDSKRMFRTSHGTATGNGRHKAFKKQPTDYYMKPFLEAHSEATDALFPNKVVAKRYCIGKKIITGYLLQHLTRFHKKFEMIPTFSFSYLTWPQQQYGMESLAQMDQTYKNFFKDFLTMPHVSERTAIVIMSDHGGLNHPYFKTEHGLLEKMNPLLMVRLPQNLVDKHPKYLDNLKLNSHRIVSPIDVHRTLSIFPKLFTEKNYTLLSDKANEPGRNFTITQELFGRNLFVSEIPYDRTCDEAFIPDTFCLCNKSLPSVYNSRKIVSDDGTPEKYWHYISLSQ